jgi:hypothetical protein
MRTSERSKRATTHQVSVNAATVFTHVLQAHRHLMQDLDYLLPIVPCDRVVGESIAEVHLGRRHPNQVGIAELSQLRVLPAPREALVVQHARVEVLRSDDVL